MTKREFEKLGKQFLPYLPEEFLVKENRMFVRPIGSLLKGVCFQGSIDKETFYVWRFIQILCVPSPSLGLNMSRRLVGGSHTWSIKDPNMLNEVVAAIQREALPHIMPIKTLEDMVKSIGDFEKIGDPTVKQAIAFAWARIGKIEQACETLDKFVEYVRLPYYGEVYWEKEITRAIALKNLLLTDPAAAQKQLDEWEAYTVKNLKLEKYI